MSARRFFLAQDSDCHWYLVQAEKRPEWNAWCELNSDTEAAWRVPDFATPVDGPHRIEFENPISD